jgi:CRP-like cAMP-binding protein
MAASSRLIGQRCRTRANQYLVREGERPGHVHLVLEGWAARYKLLPDGRRQITGVYMSGDLCDSAWLAPGQATHPVVALTPLHSARISCRDLEARAFQDDSLMRSLLGEARATLDMQAEWALNLGRKTALERLAHFFCELFTRLKAAGLTRDDRCDMPLTQLEMADFTGLTPVHVNRTLQEMRGRGLLELHARRLRIPSLERLSRIAMFNGAYLRLPRLDRPRDFVTVER